MRQINRISASADAEPEADLGPGIAAGAGRGELLNLRWQDIDLDGKKITITGSTAVIGGERVNGTTTSGRTRVVSVDDETMAVLRRHKAAQTTEQLKAGDSCARKPLP